MISRGIVPNLIVSQRVVDRVAEAAKGFLADETGESMVGLVIDSHNQPDGMPTLVVLDTISPDESVIRRSHMFEQGDNIQQDIFAWLLDNWQTYLELGKDMRGKPIQEEWRVPLRHLGDWHKQPGYMIQPSGGDLMTALRYMEDSENEFDFLLVPIVTLGWSTVTSEEGATVNYFTVPLDDGSSLRMDWWYIHRDVRIFQPITPKILPDAALPALTPYAWHVLDVDGMDDELALLEQDNLFLIGSSAVLWETDGDLPLEICFLVARGSTRTVFIVITDWNYPNAAPRARVSPWLTDIDPRRMYVFEIFKRYWEASEPITPPDDFTWSNTMYMVDFVAALEEKLGIRPQPAQREAVSIAVEVEEEEEEEETNHIDETGSDTDDDTGSAGDETLLEQIEQVFKTDDNTPENRVNHQGKAAKANNKSATDATAIDNTEKDNKDEETTVEDTIAEIDTTIDTTEETER